MKFTSRYALLVALGLGIAATAATAPAFAKKEAAAPQLKIGDAVRKALAPVNEAITKKDPVAASAAVDAARSVARTPDEQYVVAQYGLNVAQLSGDQGKLSAALDEMIATGTAANKLTDAEKAKFYWFQGQFAYQAKNYAKAEQALSGAIAAGNTEPDVSALLADSQYRNGKSAEAVATLQKVIDARAASGQPVPTEWYGRGADMASRAKLSQEFVRITTAWLAAYPVRQNWHDSLFIYRQMAGLIGETDLDLLRLARVVGALPISAQSNYIDYALAVYLKFPNEAVSVLTEGVSAGKLNPSTSQNTREILALSKPKIPADKASLPASLTAAKGPRATYKSIATTGDLAYGFGEFAKAAEMYQLALTRPGADLGQGNVRLGAALVQAGDKDGARAAFGAVTSGPYAVLASYWKVWVDHPAP